MRTPSFWVLMALCLSISAPALAQNLVQNPSFESGTLAPWTGNGSLYQGTPRAKTGTWSAYLTYQAKIEQVITGLTPGVTYQLTGWLLPWGTGCVAQIGAKDYGPGSTPVEASATYSTTYLQRSVQFVAGSNSVTIYYKRTDNTYSWTHVDELSLVNITPIITIGVSASGSGTVTGGNTYAQGASVTVTATPAADHSFLYWQEGSTVVSYDAAYTFTATANRTLTAVFSATPLNGVGMGINSAKDYEEGPKIFADALRHSRQWIKLGTSSTGAIVNANGWPQENATTVLACQIQQHGRYRLTYDGLAKPNIAPGTVSNIVYDTLNNRTSANVQIDSSGDVCTFLTLTNMSPGGVSNMQMMRPRTPGDTISYPAGTLYTDEIKAMLRRFGAVRYMDFTGANSDDYHLETEWATRTRPDYATQAVNWRLDNYQKVNPNTGKNWYDYQGKGVAWEYVIRLANETNTDAWICIPHAASDDYITKIAQAFRYGTDGVNPYTSPQANPVHPPLKANLKLYVEYSNEVWNSGFPVFHYMWDKILLEPTTSDLYFDGSTNTNYLRYRYAARRSVQISDLFRAVFGNTEMISRIRPVMEWQKGKTASGLGNTNYSGSSMLMYVEATKPNPVGYYFYGAGCSGYYQADDPTADTTVNMTNIWTRGEFLPATWAYPMQEWSVYLTACFGLNRTVYEGGPSLGDQNGSNAVNNPLGPQVVADARIKDEIIEHHTVWNQVGGDLFMYFVLGGDPRWGFMQNPSQTNSYKLQGIDAIRNLPREPITNGAQVTPTTTALIPGNQWRISNRNDGGWQTPNTALSNGTYTIPLHATRPRWVSYHFHASTSANDYKARLHYRSTTGATVRLYVGSTLVGTLTLSAASTTAITGWTNLTSDKNSLQALRVQLVSGNLTVVNAEIAGTSFSLQSPSEEVFSRNQAPHAAIRVYPNPATEMFVVEGAEGETIEVYDLTGRLVHRVDTARTAERIETAGWHKGLYFVRSRQQSTAKKILVD